MGRPRPCSGADLSVDPIGVHLPTRVLHLHCPPLVAQADSAFGDKIDFGFGRARPPRFDPETQRQAKVNSQHLPGLTSGVRVTNVERGQYFVKRLEVLEGHSGACLGKQAPNLLIRELPAGGDQPRRSTGFGR